MDLFLCDFRFKMFARSAEKRGIWQNFVILKRPDDENLCYY